MKRFWTSRTIMNFSLALMGLFVIFFFHNDFHRAGKTTKALDSSWEQNINEMERLARAFGAEELSRIAKNANSLRGNWNKVQESTTLKLFLLGAMLGIFLIALIPIAQLFTQLVQDRFKMQSVEIKEGQALAFHAAKLRDLSEIMAGVAHEINNPLSIIEGYSHRIRSLADKKVEDEALKTDLVKLHDKINNSTSRIAKVIEQMRLSARDGNNDPFKTISVNDLINHAISHYRQKLHNNCVELTEPSPDLPLELECRPVQLGHAIANLVYNAKNAVDQLEEKWIRIEAKDCNDFIEISVTDSGSGIKEDLRDKIMRPFFTTSKVGQGSGLGLNVTQGIIESHSGTLALDTSCNRTRFVVKLPKRQAHAKSETDQTQDSQKLAA